MALCAHRHPDGSFCKRHASKDSHFCYRHEPYKCAPSQPDRHNQVHPLARLSTREDVFNVVRETLNAVRLGRIEPARAYAVAHMVRLWLLMERTMLSADRNTALEKLCLPELVESDQQADSHCTESGLPLPVAVDQSAAMALLEETAPPSNLLPISDYPGESSVSGEDEPLPAPTLVPLRQANGQPSLDLINQVANHIRAPLRPAGAASGNEETGPKANGRSRARSPGSHM